MSSSEESNPQSNHPTDHDEPRSAQSQDEADIPKDELQGDVDEESTKPTSPAPANDGGNGTCHLLRMPPEIRLMIFEMVLGRRHIWPILLDDGRLGIWSCYCRFDIEKDFKSWSDDVSWAFTSHYRRKLHTHLRPPGYTSSLSLGLLRTCKDIYQEAQKIVFTKNNFVLSHVKHLRSFRNRLSHAQRDLIREVTIAYIIPIVQGQPRYKLDLWEPKFTNYIFPAPNLHKVHFVAYIGAASLVRWSSQRLKMFDLRLSKLDVPVNKLMFQAIDHSNTEPQFSVNVDCDSSLIPWFRHRYPERSEDEIRTRLGVTEEDIRKFIDRLKRRLLD
ncbi:uncharacterized protein J3D65DRAFT_82306 [Phyllosticta citribraziliensis]|uniref:DUF7730 domain-containing protein n=1 Tax=Phyllosticta citribraziliensis TaxID=989973 RepID=A0ABR1L9U8_9PEZI